MHVGGCEEHSCEERMSSYQKVVNVELLAIERPSAEQLQHSTICFLGSSSTWNTRSPGQPLSPSPPSRVLHRCLHPTNRSRSSYFRAIQPSPPVLRWDTLLRGTSRGEVSMEFSSANALFCQTSLLDDNCGNLRFLSPVVNSKYVLSVLITNYIIGARKEAGKERKTPPDDCCGNEYYIF